MRFTLRQLLLVVSTIALGLALVLADKNAYPIDDRLSGYTVAIESAFFFASQIFLLVLPLLELTRAPWRRRLSLLLYAAFLMIVPVFNVLSYPTGPIQTTYTYQEFWHLFWFALLPTGVVLLLIHSLIILSKGLIRIASGKSFGWLRFRRVVKARVMQGSGDSHGR
jgi:hypothetical protein